MKLLLDPFVSRLLLVLAVYAGLVLLWMHGAAPAGATQAVHIAI